MSDQPSLSFAEIAARLAGPIDAALDARTRFADGCPEPLREAMRYSLLAPGKRMRPILAILAAEACGGSMAAAMPAACAVEMIHAYSLIHDDLPAMDDDDLRRGRPTCHKAFDEAAAILAGDALLTLAFEVLAVEIEPKSVAAACCAALARAAGACGMVGGQADDVKEGRKAEEVASGQWPVASEKKGERGEGRGEKGEGGGRKADDTPKTQDQRPKSESPNPEIPKSRNPSSSTQPLAPSPSSSALLESIHRRKTGAMILASLRLGAMTARGNEEQLAALQAYGERLGLAFQITDDLLDVQSSEAAMGKRVGKDANHGKLTFPGLLGLDQSAQYARQLVSEACEALNPLGPEALGLQVLARYVLERNH